ncbi:MAG: Non-ribosomal peptide synthetase component, partial [Chloroflexi bacterium]|nr:Non-ribosomal peptide synthetase component [Chloroflexota bacterium]
MVDTCSTAFPDAGQANAQSIPLLLAERAANAPDAHAIQGLGGPPLTYADLWRHARLVVSSLRAAGINRQDRVAIVLPNGPEMAVTFLSVACGAITAPLNAAYRASEFDFFLGDLGAKALIVQEGIPTHAADVARSRGTPVIDLTPHLDGAGLFSLGGLDAGPDHVEPMNAAEDIALMLHTSGTTARPKLVPLTHGNVCVSASHTAQSLRLTGDDRCLNVMPLFHIHGLIGALLSSVTAGGSVVCTPGFDISAFFGWLAAHEPTWYTAVPTMHSAVLDAAPDHHAVVSNAKLRLIRSASAPLPGPVFTGLERVFGVPVIEAYGMTEASHQMAANPLPPYSRKIGSVGIAAGPEIAVVDEAGVALPAGQVGEVVIRGANVTAGYSGNPEANQNAFLNGWFRTGDQGHVDEDGYLFLTGRLKEIINRGGEKISPREIDDVLLEHPAIAQAVTFAVPHPSLGEDVAAAVVLRPGAAVNISELRTFAAARIADFKVPRKIRFLDELPKGPTGKLQRVGLAKALGLVDGSGTTGHANRTVVPPRTENEAALQELWTRVLKRPDIGMLDDFFELGGHSLHAIQVISRVRDMFGVEVQLRFFFENPTIERLALEIGDIKPAPQSGPPSSHRESHEPAPLSFAQQRLWFLSLLNPGSIAYNNSLALLLRGRLDVPAIERSVNELIRRHASLRTTVGSVDGEPVQVVAPELHLALPVVDLQALQVDDRDRAARQVAAELAEQPFDLERGPLIRAILVQSAGDEWRLLVTMHHIITDSWSEGIFVRELAALYGAFAGGNPSPLRDDLPIEYVDFTRWQREWLTGAELERQLSYWREQLEGAPAFLHVPTDYPRPPVPSYRGAQVTMHVSSSLATGLATLSTTLRVTPFVTMLAAFYVLLMRYTNEEDLLIGTPIANRTRSEQEGLIGLFVNTLVLRADLSGDPTFAELVGRVREIALGAHAHQDLPFEKLVEALDTQRNMSYAPLFQIMFNFQNAHNATSMTAADVRMDLLPAERCTAKFDLTLYVTETGDGLTCSIEYSTDLFEAGTIERMAGHWQTLLEAVVEDPGQRKGELTMLTAAECRRLLVVWNDTATHCPADRCPHQLFEEQAAHTPEAIAVRFEDAKLSYQELNERANRLARYL